MIECRRYTTFLCIDEMMLKKTRGGRYFFSFNLYDRTGSIKGYCWGDPSMISGSVKKKEYVKVEGSTMEFNHSLVIDVVK